MSSGVRSDRIPQIREARQESRLRPSPRLLTRTLRSSTGPTLLFAVLSLGVVATGCTTTAARWHQTPRQALDELAAQAGEIKTERGRAWISLRARMEDGKERKFSFPAVIAVDRTDPKMPLLRIECMDPLGATHVLLILDRRARLTWVDYDERRTDRLESVWQGVPLARLPELLLGILVAPPDSKATGDGRGGIELRTGSSVFNYQLELIDPGPRVAVREIESALDSRKKSAPEHYRVGYSVYLDKDDFYLPRDARIEGFGGADPSERTLDISLSWRERRWNEPIPMQVFAVPNGF